MFRLYGMVSFNVSGQLLRHSKDDVCYSGAGSSAGGVDGNAIETWTCPVGTQPYYYAYALFGPQPYPAAGDYALCNAPPGNFWRLPDGVTEITAVTCESAT
ncbi:unnamed protein product [Heligmosomoides polygyrus]|uniref:Ricin B-type lectin domain-containing protein n=1 Tax=Heligmosomoides polygyrus TaxID=6339 RepID=A0A183FLP7_HELPZ|nr:unnamed protein product [Heligmosomoides polygyrus]